MENEDIEEFVNHADKNKDGKINYNGKLLTLYTCKLFNNRTIETLT